MSIRFSRLAMGMLVVAALALTSSRCWAIYYGLGPSKDEWGLKYDVEVHDAGSDTLTVVLTFADEGRLKPFHSIELIAFSKQADSQGRRSYDVKAPFELKPTPDGRRAGQVQVRKEFLDRAKIRILTRTVDGKRQPSGGAYYDIPIAKFLQRAPETASAAAGSPPPTAAPSAPKVTR